MKLSNGRICLAVFGLVFLLVLTAAGRTAAAAKAQITAVRWSIIKSPVDDQKRLRIVFDLSAPIKKRDFKDIYSTGDVPQLIIDFSGITAARAVAKTQKLDGIFARQLTLSADGDSSKVVIRLNGEVDYNIFALDANPVANKPFRLVLDLGLTPGEGSGNGKADFDVSPGVRGKTIVLDAGHGGSDPGAISPAGIKEADITLAVARKVRKILQAAGAKVVMTRDADVDVYGRNASGVQELGARVGIANRNRAAVFISIHCNSFRDPSANGMSTYYYPKSRYDGLLARCVESSLASNIDLADRGVQQAGFYVIKNTRMPAVLVELAFISSPVDIRYLNSDGGQEKFARAIVGGIGDYFDKAR
ncbi:MAG: N-acetylmuramoyl-L-alanine amidase [Negativicutes bacterium]|nr:N-acetylmuramoyl-L-alanine amidase [Negativicutes bacterium]